MKHCQGQGWLMDDEEMVWILECSAT
jgi:hypothetical protein